MNGAIVAPITGVQQHPSHSPDPEGIEVLKARSAMKRRAQNTAEPTQGILNCNIVTLPQESLARLGTTEVMKGYSKTTNK